MSGRGLVGRADTPDVLRVISDVMATARMVDHTCTSGTVGPGGETHGLVGGGAGRAPRW